MMMSAHRRIIDDRESRRQARMTVNRTVGVFEPFTGETYSAVTCNVSAEGVCLRIDASIDLRPGRCVTLQGAPAVGPRLSGEGDHLTTARVVWVAPDAADPTATRVGLQVFARPVSVAA